MSKAQAQAEKDGLGVILDDVTVAVNNLITLIDSHEQDHVSYQQRQSDVIAGLQRDLENATKDSSDWQSKYNALLKELSGDPTKLPAGFSTLFRSADFADGKIPSWMAINDKFHMNGRDDLSLKGNWSIVNGVLRNTMKKEDAVGNDGVTYHVTTGMSYNQGLLPAEFHFRARCRMGFTDGFWVGWPWFTVALKAKEGAEYDPFEGFSNKGRPKITGHSMPYSPSEKHLMDIVLPPAPTKHGPEDFYLLDVEHVVGDNAYWKTWYDGELVHVFDKSNKNWVDSYHNGPSDKWNLIINTQSGGGGGKVTPNTNWDKAFAEIDYMYIFTR